MNKICFLKKNSSMRGISRRVMTNKLMVVCLAVILMGGIVLIIYLKVRFDIVFQRNFLNFLFFFEQSGSIILIQVLRLQLQQLQLQ